MTAAAGLGVPSPDSRVTVMSQDDDGGYPAVVVAWLPSVGSGPLAGPEGAPGPATLRIDADAIPALAGHQVWLLTTRPNSGICVYSGSARRGGPDTLEVLDVTTLWQDRRRTTARATAASPVTVSAGAGHRERQLRSVDLCRDGVRIALRNTSEVSLGEQVTMDVYLDGGDPVAATGHVTRIDAGRSQAVVRFDDLPGEQGLRIDRFVLLRLSPTA